MASVIGTPLARAPRNVRTKNPQLLLKNKEASPIFHNVADMVAFMDKFVELMQTNSPDKDVRSPIFTLCTNLKIYGHQLETYYKDQLDRVFIHLRNAGRDENLDKISRLYLLEVVELRAGRWAAQEQVTSYYQSKLAELESSTADTPTTTNDVPSPPVSPVQLLSAGELVKFSGKYNTTCTTQAKNFIKDEVVIRNADSGKVNPGAKERLVQITGSTSDNIERARQLIEQTIQRNASPVRQLDASVANNPEGMTAACMQQSFDTALDDFQHTVSVGEHSIQIIGQNLDLVQAAKLVLDEYFAAQRQRTASTCSSSDDGVVMTCSESPRHAAAIKKMLKYNRESLILWSNSPLCRQPPANFHRLIMEHAPEIARKVAGLVSN